VAGSLGESATNGYPNGIRVIEGPVGLGIQGSHFIVYCSEFSRESFAAKVRKKLKYLLNSRHCKNKADGHLRVLEFYPKFDLKFMMLGNIPSLMIKIKEGGFVLDAVDINFDSGLFQKKQVMEIVCLEKRIHRLGNFKNNLFLQSPFCALSRKRRRRGKDMEYESNSPLAKQFGSVALFKAAREKRVENPSSKSGVLMRSLLSYIKIAYDIPYFVIIDVCYRLSEMEMVDRFSAQAESTTARLHGSGHYFCLASIPPALLPLLLLPHAVVVDFLNFSLAGVVANRSIRFFALVDTHCSLLPLLL
jgi:hypothetical protein